MGDDRKIRLGDLTGGDLKLYHDGSNSYLQNKTGYLYVQADNISLAGQSAGENYLVANLNGAVQLYYDNSKKFETTSSGVNVTGAITVNGSALSSGLFSSYAIIADTKSAGTHGGQPPNTSDFNKRDLNTEIADPDGIVSISSNSFVLQAGSYYIHAMPVGYRMNKHQAMIYNETDSSVVQYGISRNSDDYNAGQGTADVYARVTIGSQKTFGIYHRCSNTDGEGYGLANSFGTPQTYTIVEIFKES